MNRYLKREMWIPGVITGVLTATSFLFILVASLVGCGPTPAPGTPGPKLLVTSFAPLESQGLAGTTAAVRIRFNAPVVDSDQVGRTLASAPAAVAPLVKVAAAWTDRQTLVLRPTSPLRPSTRYQVSLTDRVPGLRGKTRFTFVHRPISVLRLSGADPSRLPTAPVFILHFNQPVLAGEVARGCVLGQRRGEGVLPLGTPDREVVTSAVHLRPLRPLRLDSAYTLRCAGLRGHGGDAVLASPFVRRLRTYPRFKVLSFGPTSQRIPSDEVPVTVQFSTPVKLDAVRRAVSIRPWARGIQRGTLDPTGTRYTAVLDLKVTTRYSVSIDRQLQDAHGQHLGRWMKYTFTTTDASARMTLERGIYALESSQEGYPVWTRNVRGFQVECARVPHKRVVRLLTSSMNYDPWYDSAADRDLEWKKLGLRRRRHRVRIRHAKNKWKLTRLDLSGRCGGGKRGKGLYLAELRSRDISQQSEPYRQRPRQRVLANVTNLGVLLKVGPASGLVWVTSIDSGKPVPGAVVTVHDLRGKRVHQATTDRQGLVRLPGSNRLLRQPGAHAKNNLEGDSIDDYDIHRSQRLIVVVRKAGDMAVVDGNWQNGIQIWNFGVPVERSGGRTRVRGFIQSDRGIYRPGEKVHFKGLVRETLSGRRPRVPARAFISVHVEDSRGAVIFRRRLRLSRFGGFSFDLPLGPEAALGDYHVTARLAKQTFRERFMVEEFRKVSYELEFSGHERHTRRGRKQRFFLGARYLFGAPVTEARVKWSVQRRPHSLRFARFPQYTFRDNAARGRYHWWRPDSSHPQFVTEGSGVTNKGGRYGFAFADTTRGLDGPQDYLVQATVTDETDQSVSRRAVRTAHPTDLYLGLHAQELVQAVDMPFAVNTAAMAPGGKQVAARGTLSYLRERYHCRYSKNNGYRAVRTCTRKHVKVWSRPVSIPATGNGVERIKPKKPGEYIVRLEGTDSRGRRVAASTYVWIIGKGEAFWSGDESARLSLVASKRIYSPGEKARLVPRANMAGASALVTLERGGVLDAFVTSLQTSGSGLEIPLHERHAPNVFASVALVRGRTGTGDANRPRFKMGVVDLRVSSATHRLNVRVHTERRTYEPGQPVKGTLEVTDHQGKPVRAEVSLSVADEGVLQLIAYKTPNPMKTFYRPYGLGVDSSTNLNRIARLNDPTVNDPDEGGDSGGTSGARVRSRFVNSAFWAPGLITNARGSVSFSFAAPDNLTAFRLMAVAADAGSRFGAGDARLTVRKPLLAKPALPRFLRSGDRAELGIVLHNHTGRAGTATVRLRARGVALSQRARRVKLRRGGSARVSFTGEVKFLRQAKVRFSVRMGRHSDALAVTLPVHRPLSIQRRTLSSGEVDGLQTVALAWPGDLLAADSRLEVTVDRTGLGELRGGLLYLIEYPYGCLEQTLSRFIPLTKVKDLADSLNLPQLRGPRLRAFTRAGVAKVLRHQHDTGHFSLWPGGQTYPHLTTYAMYGLNEARRARIRVDRGGLARGVRAMRAWANSSQRSLRPGGEIATMAMAAFVLADLGQADAGLNARLLEARKALPRYGQAFLLRALKKAGAPLGQVRVVQRELLVAITGDARSALVRESFRGRATFDSMHWYMSSDVRTTAITLSALLETVPGSPAVKRLAAGLKRARRADGRWNNTQDNLYSLVALSDLARSRARGSSLFSLSLDGRRLVRARVRGSRVLTFSRALNRLKPGTLTLVSKGRVRYAVRLVQARRITRDQAEDKGFTVSRQYLHSKTNQPVSTFTAGQLVQVKLTVRTAKDRAYVALVDPLPAGLEAVNTRLATSHSGPPVRATRRWWYRSRPTWSHKELRDDQARFFSDRMAAGSYTLTYRARATTAGTFTAAPARAEAMYEPDVSGHSTAARIEVRRSETK